MDEGSRWGMMGKVESLDDSTASRTFEKYHANTCSRRNHVFRSNPLYPRPLNLKGNHRSQAWSQLHCHKLDQHLVALSYRFVHPEKLQNESLVPIHQIQVL